MEYKAEDYIKFIEQKRFDKIGAWGMEIIAKKYRRLEQNKGQNLPLDSVSNRPCLGSVEMAVHDFFTGHNSMQEITDEEGKRYTMEFINDSKEWLGITDDC
tara:strand:+ start:1272 stop:1574 length:303 start_codon:yes stop_codon:yes gene_type:complete